MLKELKSFIKRSNLQTLNTPLKGSEADAAIEKGMQYFREHGKNYYPGNEYVRDAVRSLTQLQRLDGAPKAEAQVVLNAIEQWGDAYILGGKASTYASIFKQGQTNKNWTEDGRLAAKEFCEFFKI